jgi:hypothetical protein
VSATFLQSIETQGFVVAPACVPFELIAQITALLEKALASQIGHGDYAMRHVMQLVPALAPLIQKSSLPGTVAKIIGDKARVVRSLFFDKTPEANWKVAWHQDLTIAVAERIDVPDFGPWSTKNGSVHVQPPVAFLERMLTVRIHLDDCPETNGPLRVIPGSHRSGRLDANAIQRERKSSPEVLCAMNRGGALLMRPLLLHASSPSLRPEHRRVLHLEFSSDELPGGLRWLE